MWLYLRIAMEYRNIKTGQTYTVISTHVINATNNDLDVEMVLYKNKDGKLFVREKQEFDTKFEEVVSVSKENKDLKPVPPPICLHEECMNTPVHDGYCAAHCSCKV